MGWDAGVYDDFDFDYEEGNGKRPCSPLPPTCRECDAECVWVSTTRGWRLGDDEDTLHECEPEDRDALISEDFDVVE